VLLVINGAPGVGKSTLASRFAKDAPLALILDIDSIRTHLGQWQERDESKVVARDLAIALARAHLLADHDVIVPQFFWRHEFRDRLAALAREVGVPFVEVVLTADEAAISERFRRRRDTHAELGVDHPQSDLPDETVSVELPLADARLVEDARTREVPIISTADDVDESYRALREAVRGADLAVAELPHWLRRTGQYVRVSLGEIDSTEVSRHLLDRGWVRLRSVLDRETCARLFAAAPDDWVKEPEQIGSVKQRGLRTGCVFDACPTEVQGSAMTSSLRLREVSRLSPPAFQGSTP
jgi:predicted kinase